MEQKRISLTITCLMGFVLFSWGQLLPHQNLRNWNTVFEDDMSSFNQSRWYKAHNEVHGSKRNEEPQIYMAEYANILNNQLVLTTDRLTSPMPHPNNDSCYYNNQHYYVSGEIRSRIPYQYGYYEIYAKIPAFKGAFPAFWLQASHDISSDPWYNEIDIFEGNGSITDSLSTNRWWSFDYPVNSHFPSPNEGINYFSSNYSQNYHWYSMLWDKNKIVWYFDRQPVRIEANTCGGEGIQHPLYIYINAALRPFSWDDDYSIEHITMPRNMYVDQVNVYQIDCMDKNVVVNDISNFSTYNYSLKRSISLTNATTLPSNSDIVLYAREFIELDNGFSVPVGTSLYLDVFDSCE